MSLHIDTYRTGRGHLYDEVNEWLPLTAHAVEQHFRVQLADLYVTLTDERGLTDLAVEAAGHFAPKASWAARKEFRQERRKFLRGALGVTDLGPGGVHIWLDSRRLRPGKKLGVTLAHELVHAAQLGRPKVREEAMIAARNNLGVDVCTDAQVVAMNAAVEDREREAERLEKPLYHAAKQLA